MAKYGIGSNRCKNYRDVKKDGPLAKLTEKVKMSLQEEYVETKFPILDFPDIDRLLTNLDNIKPLDTSYINKYFIDNLLKMSMSPEDKKLYTEAPFISCTALSLSSTRLMALGTNWDFIIIYNLNDNSVKFLKQKRQNEYGKITTMDFSPSGQYLIVGY